MIIAQFIVAVVWSVFTGFCDGIYVMAMTMIDVPVVCFLNGCWPWECHGGVEIQNEFDE